MNEVRIFQIRCMRCLEAGVKPEEMSSHLFINFEKRYSMISCLRQDCGAYEVFDEEGNQIVLPEGKEIDGKVEKKNQAN